VNKLIFASLLSVGAILAAQAPAAQAPAADSKTQSPASTTAKVKKPSKKHHKKTTAVNANSVKPATK
jgi:hypothetical protein